MALPGVNTIINDRMFTLSRTEIPLGPRIAIIGMRNDPSDSTIPADNKFYTDGSGVNGVDSVADLDPYNAANESEVIKRFGAESHLHRAYLEAVAGGATRVTLIALPADTTFTHNTGTIASADYDAATATTGQLFNDAFSACEAIRADIIVPWGRGGGPTEFQSPATPGDDEEIGFHADNTATVANSWVKKVADKCAEITANSYPCFAVLGVKPFVGSSSAEGGMTPAQVNTHLGLSTLSDHESQALGANGIYVNVVTTEITPVGYNNNYTFGFSNGACLYAGYIAQLDSWSAPTGKTVFNVERIRYNPTRTQQLAMIGKGVVPVALNFNRTPVWVDAQTFGKENSDYHRLTTLRIVFDSVQLVRQVAQQFIGEASNLNSRNALETAITAGLRGMQQLGALLASDFAMTYIPSENKAIIDLVLSPAFELRNIEVRVAVQL